MKNVVLLMVLCVMGMMCSGAWAEMVFSANYDDGTVNAQISGGALAPSVVEDGAANIGLTSGGQGYGGSGEGLRVPDAQDKLIYHDPFGVWDGTYVGNGRLTVNMNITSVPPAVDKWYTVFELAPRDVDPVYEPWTLAMGRVTSQPGAPTMLNMVTADLWSSGTGYTYYGAYVASDPLNVPGWHTITTEWAILGDWNHFDVKVFVDGVKAMDVQNVLLPMPYWWQDLYIGSYHNASHFSIGEYGYIDNVTIEAIPEPATMGLLAVGFFAFVSRRKRK